MPVTTLSAQSISTPVSVEPDTYSDLVPPASVMGTGDSVMLTAYVRGMNPNTVQVQILVDDVVLREDVADGSMTIVFRLSSGPHTIKFQAYSLGQSSTAGERAMTVLNLT